MQFSIFPSDGGLVDEADHAQFIHARLAGGRQVLVDNVSLEQGQQGVLVPGVMGEELLKRPHRAPGGQSHRLDALAWQVADQPPAIGSQVVEAVARDETGAEVIQEFGERRPQASHLLASHP